MTTPTTIEDWTRWALRVPVAPSRHVGEYTVRCVLVALAQYADDHGRAWPSAQRLAEDIAGMTRRDVRNALAAAVEGGAIRRDGKAGRAVRWQLVAPVDNTNDLAGYPATSESANVAGEVAGEVAGDLAGYPATNRTEGKYPPTPHRPHGASVAAIAADLAARRPDLDPPTARRVVDYLAADPDTRSLAGRARSDHAVNAALDALRAERAREAEQHMRELDRQAPCPHGTPGGQSLLRTGTHTGLPRCALCRSEVTR